MDESAQQAVQLGVNITIFIVALSISLTLLLGVRDVAEVAADYDASIPTGSRVVDVSEQKKRLISGNELLSYCANYMTDLNNAGTNRYVIVIKDSGETFVADDMSDVSNIKTTLGDSLKKEYEVITELYDEPEGILTITLQSIETE